jgi:hypothetical protein
MTRMPIIQGADVDGRAFPDYTWNADLISFDGPLLSLYRRDVGGQDALFFWLDTDNRKNRWGVVELTRSSLRDYLRGHLSLRNVIKQAHFVYVFNVGVKRRTNIKRLRALPDFYLPKAESFLYSEISTNEAKALIEEEVSTYKLLLSGDDLYVDDLAVIPRLYQQLYSFHYGMGHLDRAAVRDRLASTVRDWKGGFSSVHLFGGMKAVIPSIHRARVSNLQYASPGHIGMELLPDMARKISEVVLSLDGEGIKKMEHAYSSCYRYFRDEKISGFEDGDDRRVDQLTPVQLQTIKNIVIYFVENLRMPSVGQAFEEMEIDVLGQLRAVLAYYRRLRQLYSYVESGTLKIPAI